MFYSASQLFWNHGCRRNKSTNNNNSMAQHQEGKGMLLTYNGNKQVHIFKKMGL